MRRGLALALTRRGAASTRSGFERIVAVHRRQSRRITKPKRGCVDGLFVRRSEAQTSAVAGASEHARAASPHEGSRGGPPLGAGPSPRHRLSDPPRSQARYVARREPRVGPAEGRRGRSDVHERRRKGALRRPRAGPLLERLDPLHAETLPNTCPRFATERPRARPAGSRAIRRRRSMESASS